jgi:hypothetical protein
MKKRNKFIDLLHNLNNIGELLLVLKPFTDFEKIEKWALYYIINNRVGKCCLIPSINILIEISIFFNLINVKKQNNKEYLVISNLGKNIIKYPNSRDDRLTKKQAQYLFSNVLFDKLKFDILNTLEIFQIFKNNNIFVNCFDKRIDNQKGIILKLFQQLYIATLKDNNILIYEAEKNLLENLLFSKNGMDEKELLSILKNNRRIGILAEEYVLQKEKEYLKKCGRVDLVNYVRRISKKNVKSGFDILSFYENNKTYINDKFIEVKGCANENNIFYITRNEYESCKEYEDNYWLYIVSNVNKKGKEKLYKINNPFNNLFSKYKNIMESIMWKVDLNTIKQK